MTRALVALLATAMSVAAAPTASIQDTPLPSGREVIARSIEALGGQKAFLAVKSVHAVGKMTIVGPGISGDMEMFSARPDRVVYRLNITGIGKVENGYDGKVGWSVNPVSGPELLTGKQLQEASEDAWFDAPLHMNNRVRSVEVVGRAEFDGHQTYKVRVVLPSGNEQFEYFDLTSGLQAGSEMTRTLPQGVVPTTNFTRDYKKFGALLQATTIVQRALGLEQVVTITSVDYDKVPDSVFQIPADVKPLLTK
ncbi:MAG: hypothetical protein ABI634_17900 [Acidobacteriota bacterium]